MILDVSLNQPIKIMPSSVEEEIIQNVLFLLRTMRGTCPMYRQFGLDTSLIDKPLNFAQSLIVAEVADAIHTWEPRCKLESIVWKESDVANGELIPLVSISIED